MTANKQLFNSYFQKCNDQLIVNLYSVTFDKTKLDCCTLVNFKRFVWYITNKKSLLRRKILLV